MHGKRSYKFKVISGVLSWKNEEMDKFMPVSAEILTRVILLYEKEFKKGLEIWKQIEENDKLGISTQSVDILHLELADWMEKLKGIFSDMEPFRKKGRWMDDPIQLN